MLLLFLKSSVSVKMEGSDELRFYINQNRPPSINQNRLPSFFIFTDTKLFSA